MEIKDARCTNCGASLKVEPQKTITTCEYCHSDILISGAIELALVEVDKTKDLLSYRTLLEGAIAKNSISEILRVSRLILDIIPSDVSAQYYFSYAKQTLNEPSFMKAFYRSTVTATPETLESLIQHINQRSDLRDKALILDFLKRHSPEMIESYEASHGSRVRQEDQYANVLRDVFICHSSRDKAVALNVVETLEKEGFTCWISTRNLRPEDSENYWNNITDAIHNTKLLLVISSEASMLSKDVQKEIELSQKFNQPRFEYKIDETPQTVLFKHTFEGIKWVEGVSDPLSHVKKLPSRVYEELSKVKKETPEPTISLPNRFKLKKLLIPLLLIFIMGASGILLAMNGVFTTPTYTLTFEDYDGTVIETLTLNEGDVITYPSDPSRPGYTFTSWSDSPETITEELTLEAVYEINTYTVVFEDFDGDILDSLQVNHGSPINPPNEPSRMGYQFMGWNQTLTNVTEDLTVTASYERLEYTVTYLNHLGNVIKTDTVYHGEDSIPPTYEREGYTLAGWNLSYQNITRNTTLSPRFEVQTFTVRFEDYDGTVLESYTVNYGENSPTPAMPTRKGYLFTGWNASPSNITQNTTIRPIYEEGTTYTVSFESNGGTTVSAIQVLEDSKIGIPDVSKEGHTLEGWYISVNGGETFDERWQFTSNSNTVASNFTLYAKWTINEYTITVRYNNTQNDLTITQDYGTEVSIPKPNSKEGHTFTGWSRAIPNTMPGENLTIDANWDINQYTLTLLDHDDSVIETFTFDFGEDLSELNEYTVEREGHTFKGWDSVIPSNMPSEDIELIANYDVNKYLLELKHKNEVVYSATIDYGSLIIPPVMSNNDFNELNSIEYLDKQISSKEIIFQWENLPKTMPAKNLILSSEYISFTESRLNVFDNSTTRISKIDIVNQELFIGGSSASTDMFFETEEDLTRLRNFFVEFENLTPSNPIIFNEISIMYADMVLMDFVQYNDSIYSISEYHYRYGNYNIFNKTDQDGNVQEIFRIDVDQYGVFERIFIHDNEIIVLSNHSGIIKLIKLNFNGITLDSIEFDNNGSKINSAEIFFGEQSFYVAIKHRTDWPDYLAEFDYQFNKMKETEFSYSYTFFTELYVNESGELYLIGYEWDKHGYSRETYTNGLLMKFDENLNLISKQTFGGTKSEIFTDIIVYEDSLIIVGNTNSYDGDILDSQGSYDTQGWLLVLDKELRLITSETIGKDGNNFIKQVLINNDEILISAAYDSSNQAAYPSDLIIIKLVPNG